MERVKVTERDAVPHIYDCTMYTCDDQYIRVLKSKELWQTLKYLYQKIEHIKYVGRHDFSVRLEIAAPKYTRTLLESELTDDSKSIIKSQVVKLVVELNRAGVAHRDMHAGNFFYDGDQIYLSDIEFLHLDDRPLDLCYDITGQPGGTPFKGGDVSPMTSHNMHLFHANAMSMKNVIGIREEDFEPYIREQRINGYIEPFIGKKC